MDDYLTYPFDAGLILRKKKSIRRMLLEGSSFVEKKIAILGGSTTSEIKDILELFLLHEKIKPIFYESEFNKYYEDIIFDNLKLLAFAPDLIYIHTTNANINFPQEFTDKKEYIEKEIEKEFSKFKNLWLRIREKYHCLIIQNNFELPFYRALGNIDASNIQGRTYFITRLNIAFAQYAQDNKDFYINDINYLSSWFSLEKWYDRAYWYSYKYAFSYEAIPMLSYNIANIIKAIYGKTKKCLVLDLDNVLWGGVIGDDGIENIKIGKDSPEAEAHTEFQQFVKEFKKRGVILAVCSKNDSRIAKEGLSHVDNILKLEDFTVFKANWKEKIENIVDIAKEINIGLDSLVFIDDNPAERERIRCNLKEVTVPDVGNDVVAFIPILDKAGYFEPTAISADDIQRGDYYRENVKREEYQKNFSDYGDFLKTLKMTAEIHSFMPLYLDRITQLINKTNQFNLTARKYSYSEVETISRDANCITLYGKLRDKFGDNGLVSVIIGSIKNAHELHIDLWLMSCRVLKRGLECAMFDALVSVCKAKGINRLIGYFYKTNKNQMVSQHYQQMGFACVLKKENGDSVWSYDISAQYVSKNTIIHVKGH